MSCVQRAAYADYVRQGAFGAPWESVVRLSQQTGGKGVWINVPVQVRVVRGGLQSCH